MSNQTDFKNYDVPFTTKRLNDATPDEWDRAFQRLQELREAEKKRKPVFEGAEDDNVNRVVESYLDRAAAGMNKYGVTTSANPLDLIEWLTHLQEELMDATIYIERTIEELSK